MGKDWWDTAGPVPSDRDNSDLTRNWFPEGFIFGAATSCYQVEGAYAKDGKGLSIWDDFTMRTPDKIEKGANGVVACDVYHKYKEDILRMKQMGFNSYRFSLSWSRILPGGRPSRGINRKGIDYYNDVINTVIKHEMEPCVTIFHWDLPDCLEKEYGGFMNEKIKDDFRQYAEICFNEFGDRVKLWATLNEPLTYAVHGYVVGIFPPGKKLKPADSRSTRSKRSTYGISPYATEPFVSEIPNKLFSYRFHQPSITETPLSENMPLSYRFHQPRTTQTRSALNMLSDMVDPSDATAVARDLGEAAPKVGYSTARLIDVSDLAEPKDAYNVARNMLLAHAEAAKLYKAEYQECQNGKIGIVLNSHWCEPFTESVADKKAASRAMDFMLGWFLEPALYGKYPDTMTEYVSKKNLEPFTEEESEMLRNSIDFLGLNYYTAQYAQDDPKDQKGEGYGYDQKLNLLNDRKGIPIGEQSPGSSWLRTVPWGFYNILKRIRDKYSKDLEEIYVTENGCSDKYDITLPAEKCLGDSFRQKYYQDHLANLVKVMKDCPELKDKVKGYYAWTWCDNFEWNAGYSARFGLVFIDYGVNQTRHPKESCAWFAQFLRSKRLPPVPVPWNIEPKPAGKRSNEDITENESQKKLKVVKV